MRISENGLALITRFEGFSAEPYLCPAGKWTVGYGHVIQEAGGKIQHSDITEQEATELLLQDVAIAEEAVNQLVNIPLNQNQFDALVSLVFNIGVGAFERSSLLSFLRKQESHAKTNLDSSICWNDEVANQFSRWIYSKGKRLAGLVARRKAEAELFSM